MPQAEFAPKPANAPVADAANDAANDPAGLPLAVSIFADERAVREQLRGDVVGAGLGVRQCGLVADCLAGEPQVLGEVVLVDCPSADGAALAALARLDMRVARAGGHLIVSAGAAALEDVFACCDQSRPQILVDPTRAERVIAVARALARIPHLRLRELSQGDRAALLHLTEQLGEIARRLEPSRAFPPIRGEDRVLRFESPVAAFAAQSPPPLPDPRLVRRVIRQRQLRARFIDPALFADPAWDILLDLTAAEAERTRVSVTSLCIASGVPPTTALRWIGQMCETGLLRRVADETDRRRAFIALTDEAADAMARYFAALGPTPVPA